MKHCAVLASYPPSLTQFRSENPNETNWEIFRQGGQRRYNELAEALHQRQRGICAFCEAPLVTNIPTPARQVEHWIPKSNGGNPTPSLTFGIENLHASCLGGSKTHLPPPFGTLGLEKGDNVSCGQKKGDIDPETFPIEQRPYRPTELPVSPPIFSVDLDGTLAPNQSALADGLSGGRIDSTIDYLGLNCERLKLSRAAVRNYLNNRLAEYETAFAYLGPTGSMRNALAQLASELTPLPGTELGAFISVLRDFFGPEFSSLLLPDPNWAIG